MFNARDVLLYFSLKFDGDYERILEAIKTKVKIDENDYLSVISVFKGQFITIVDGDYPEQFKRIYRPPLVIYYKGDVSLLSDLSKAIAIVGTRKPSDYGEMMTYTITRELVKHGFLVVSGMAKGIDACAHEATLLEKGKTIAVLGSGIENPYPAQNKELYQKIGEAGLVLSEYPHHTKPNKSNFPERNRIVAGLSRGVLVTEAKIHSGTLITVGASLAAGGDIFCVPSRALEDSGTNRLIKDGAYLVEDANDIINLWTLEQK